jgi:hypothetical protein
MHSCGRSILEENLNQLAQQVADLRELVQTDHARRVAYVESGEGGIRPLAEGALKSQAQLASVTEVPQLMMRSGEGKRLVVAAWQREYPGAPEAMIISSIFGAVPRAEYCTRESVRAIVANVKAFLEQSGDCDKGLAGGLPAG